MFNDECLGVPQCPIAFSTLPLCVNTKSNQQGSTESVWFLRRRLFVFSNLCTGKSMFGGWCAANVYNRAMPTNNFPFLTSLASHSVKSVLAKSSEQWEAETCTVWHNEQKCRYLHMWKFPASNSKKYLGTPPSPHPLLLIRLLHIW